MIFNNYPYIDFHEMNLDWVIKMIKELDSSMDEFKVVNSISFGGVWNISSAYQAWTIVDTASHTGYISIKAVPAGVNITNENYWRQVANYSELYADVQNRIIALENNVSALSNNVANISIKTGDSKYLCIADSYGMRSTSQPTWTELFVSKYPNTRQKSTSSIGFTTASPDNPNFSFLGKLQEFYAELTAEDRSSITDIIVCGGWNDARSLTTGLDVSVLQAKIVEFVQYANVYFPNATPWIGFIGWQSSDCVQPETTHDDLINAQFIYNNTNYGNLKHLSGVSDIMKNTAYLDATFFHPNPSGSLAIFNGIAGCLHGGYHYDYFRPLSASDIIVNPTASATLSSGFVEVTGETAIIELRLSNCTQVSGDWFIAFTGHSLPMGHNKDVFASVIDFPLSKSIYSVLQTNKFLYVYGDLTNDFIIIRIVCNTKYDR